MNIAEITAEPRVFNTDQIVPRRLSWQEYLQFGDENTLAEWIDGRVIMLFSGSTKHQQIAGFLDRVVGFYIESHNLGQVFTAPYAMKLSKLKREREPDLLFVSREREHLITKTYLDRAADLVVEIVSPESVERDNVQKFAEYEAAGVREYWLIDYTNQTATFYQLDDKGQYQAAETTNEVFYSTVLPGFFIRESWLWQERPQTLEALR
jgi:Uma2 family endonuclease